MSFSVIIPARNAASTLDTAVNSVIEQTYRKVEIIIVDDGSDDLTASVAYELGAQDSRVTVCTIPHGGVSIARNEGLRLARNDWIAFLDADDWVAPTYLQCMAAEAQSDPTLRAICCDWAYVTSDGRTWSVPQQLAEVRDFFALLARHCPFSMHSCVVRTELAREIGGFDPTLPLGEDWDFWLRVARAERRFGYVPELLAYYHIGGDSAAIDGVHALRHNARVLRRAYRSDRRVREPIPRYARGMTKTMLPMAMLSLIVWMAGLVIGRHESPRGMIKECGDFDEDAVAPADLGWALFISIARSRGGGLEDWSAFHRDVLPVVQSLLGEIEQHVRAPGLSRRVIAHLEALIIEHGNVASAARLLRTECRVISADASIDDLTFPAAIERLSTVVEFTGRRFGVVTLPVCDRRVSAAVIVDAIASTFAWELFLGFARIHVYDTFEVRPDRLGLAIWRGSLCLAAGVRATVRNFWDIVHQAIGWTVFLQEFWGRPEWPVESFYDGTTHADESGRAEAADLHQGIETAAPLRGIAIASPAVTLPVRLAGVVLGLVRFEAANGEVTAGAIRSAITRAVGPQLLHIAVREGLVGRSWDRGPKQHRLRFRECLDVGRVAARKGAWSAPLGIGRSPCSVDRRCTVIGRSNPYRYFGGDLDRVQFPASAQDALLRAALSAGRPSASCNIRKRLGPELSYAPDFIDPSTPPVEQQAPPRYSAPFDKRSRQTESIPILAYTTAQTRSRGSRHADAVTIRQFRAQIKLLVDLGCHVVSLSQWAGCMAAREPVAAGTVVITFDGLDWRFEAFFWPVLKRAGFSAGLFLPTDSIGAGKRLRRYSGPRLSRALLQRMRDGGIEIGALGASSRSFTGMSHHEIVREAADSLIVLHERVASALPALAYPNGETDQVVERLAGGAGYCLGLTVAGRECTLGDAPMALPRFRIRRDTSHEDFTRLVRP